MEGGSLGFVSEPKQDVSRGAGGSGRGIHHGHHERATPTGLSVQFWGLEGLILVRNNKASFLGMRLGWGGPLGTSQGVAGRGKWGAKPSWLQNFCWGDERVLDIDSGDDCAPL